MSTLTIDIETIPTEDEGVIANIASKIEPPKNMKKAETIAQWETEKKPIAIEEAVQKTALNGGYGKIVCIGWAFDDVDIFHQVGDEKTVIESFYEDFRSHFSPNVSYTPTIVGFNHVNFDMRFLLQRSILLGIKPPALLPFNVRQWDKNVYDVMSNWAGYGNYISLDELASIFGLEGKGMSGADVYPLYQQGKLKEIGEYCAHDVELTREIYRRMIFAEKAA